MKWIFLIAVLAIVFVILRRMSEQRITTGAQDTFSPPPMPPDGLPDQWSTRAPMPFDDFYSRYYAEAGLDREYVKKTLDYIAKSGGVAATQIRPEDRLDQFPKKGLQRGLHIVEMVLSSSLGKIAEQQGIPIRHTHFETVDDVIRGLEPHKEAIAGHLTHEDH